MAFILTGVLFYRNTHTFLTQSETTTGVVTDLVRGSSHSYRLVVRFETPEGDVITFQSNVGSNPPSYRIGEAVKVRYLLEDLHRARIDSFLQLWFLSILFGGMGFVFGSVGGVMFLIAYRSAREERWLHGIVIGIIASLPMAFSVLPDTKIFFGAIVMGLTYGFLTELITTVLFKAKA